MVAASTPRIHREIEERIIRDLFCLFQFWEVETSNYSLSLYSKSAQVQELSTNLAVIVIKDGMQLISLNVVILHLGLWKGY